MSAPGWIRGVRIVLLASIYLPIAAAAQDAVKGALQMERLLTEEFRAGRADLQKAPRAAPKTQSPAPAPATTTEPAAAPAVARAVDRGVDPAVLRSREVELAAARAEALQLQKRVADLTDAVKAGQGELETARRRIARLEGDAAEDAQRRQKVEQEAAAAGAEVGRLSQKVDVLSAQTHRGDAELAAAKAEVKRLQDIAKRIVEANRREKKDMHYNIACVFRAGKLLDRAEEEFKKALAIDPNDPAIHFNLGILYDEDLKNTRRAREHYTRFLELAPEDPDAAKVREWLSGLM